MGKRRALADFRQQHRRGADFADGTEIEPPRCWSIARACHDRPQRAAPPWRHNGRRAIWLAHDYEAAALVCAPWPATARMAAKPCRSFCPSGPLALSAPARPATARADMVIAASPRHARWPRLRQDVFAHELGPSHARPCRRADAPGGPRGLQKLVSLALAENYVDGHICLLGEAAHIIHPLAGQGFNLPCAMRHNWPTHYMTRKVWDWR
jgi:2-polyprenyl-6-methoxyphenol hydroxylase-like FAD-dependent oxidoreductase